MAERREVPTQPIDLVHGGPLWRMLVRAGLAAPEASRIVRRALVLVAISWVPPFAWCLSHGVALPGRVDIPFLRDVAAQTRILLVIPLLVASEPLARLIWLSCVRRLVDEGFVPPERHADLERQVRWALGWRDRAWPEALLLLLAMTHVSARRLGWYDSPVPTATGWHGTTLADGRLDLNFAGQWHLHVGILIGTFLTFRWFLRIGIWYAFLHRVARLDLRVQPLHADRAGGLSFLGRTLEGYTLVAFAYSATLCSMVVNRILYTDARLSDFYVTLAVWTGTGLLLLVGPLLGILVPRLAAARTAALTEFGRLTAEYGRRFARRWGRGVSTPAMESEPEEVEMPELGDFYAGMDVIREMKPLPLRVSHVIELAAALALPVMGPVLVSFPVEDLARRLFDLLHVF